MCMICENIFTKKQKITRMREIIQRWEREGNRPAIVQKTQIERDEIVEKMLDLNVLLREVGKGYYREPILPNSTENE
jgi:hypothetical protein